MKKLILNLLVQLWHLVVENINIPMILCFNLFNDKPYLNQIPKIRED